MPAIFGFSGEFILPLVVFAFWVIMQIFGKGERSSLPGPAPNRAPRRAPAPGPRPAPAPLQRPVAAEAPRKRPASDFDPPAWARRPSMRDEVIVLESTDRTVVVPPRGARPAPVTRRGGGAKPAAPRPVERAAPFSVFESVKTETSGDPPAVREERSRGPLISVPLLRSPEGLRQAMIINEIFQPPLSLRGPRSPRR